MNPTQTPDLALPTPRLSTEDVMESMSEAQDSINSANSLVNDALTSALKRLEMLDQETAEINKIINMLQQQVAMFRTPISQLQD